MLKKISLVFLILLGTYLLLPDVDVSSGAASWLSGDIPAITGQDNLFTTLVGLTVPANANANVEGARLINSANSTLDKFLTSADRAQDDMQPQYDDHWVKPDLVVTEGVNQLCDPRIKDCREIWTSQTDTIRQLAIDNTVLLQRYLELQHYPLYQTTLRADVHSPLPDFSTVMALNRLYGATLAVRVITGETGTALIDLRNDMNFIRRFILQADTLIAKMVALSMLKHDVYLYAAFMDIIPATSRLFEEVSLLTQQEASLEKPVQYEFRMNANLAHQIKSSPQQFASDLPAPAWLPFPLFRVNHSINLIHHAFSSVLEESRLPAPEFYLRQLDAKDKHLRLRPGWLSYAYNPIGCILFTLSIPDLGKYITRIHDMNGLITMVNLKRSIYNENIKATGIVEYLHKVKNTYFNPYTQGSIAWNPGEQVLSFNSPGLEPAANKLTLVLAKDQVSTD